MRFAMPIVRLLAGLAVLCAPLATCSKQISSSARLIDYPRQRVAFPEEAIEFFEKHRDFFVFARPEDLPQNLRWESGAGVPEIGSPAAKKGGTHFSYIPDFPRTLRFVGPEANGSFRSFILDNNVLALAERNPNTLEHYPALAREWAVGEDGRTLFFRLDPDATFSDGVPVRADDYFFCFYFMRSKFIVDPWYNDWYSTKYSRITKYDDLTISITLPEQKPDLLYRTANVRPVPVHFYAEFADDYLTHYQWQFEPTTGPYEVRPENIDKGRSITLTKVPNWWARDRKNFRYRFNSDRTRCQVIRDREKIVEIFRKGEIDIYAHAGITPDVWHKKLTNQERIIASGYVEKATFYNQIPRPSWGMSLNCSKPLLGNRDIRQGLHYATNWELVCKEVFKGDAVPMETSSDGYSAVTFPETKARRFDVTKAEEAFARAGFTKRGGDGIFVNDQGQRLSFNITTGYKRHTEALTVIQQEARKAGVHYNLEILDQTTAWKKIDEKKHEISFAAKNTSVELYPRFWETFHSANAYKPDGSINTDTNNETQTASKDLDALIEAYDKSSTMEDIVRLARQIVKWLHEDAAFIPGWVEPFYRTACWRWVKWPEDFNVKTSRDWEEFHLFWIDPEAREETRRAMREGKTFPLRDLVFDQYRNL
ncbi:MAG: extracellular solute-binding protein [Verrucomicrobiales bacterium]